MDCTAERAFSSAAERSGDARNPALGLLIQRGEQAADLPRPREEKIALQRISRVLKAVDDGLHPVQIWSDICSVVDEEVAQTNMSAGIRPQGGNLLPMARETSPL